LLRIDHFYRFKLVDIDFLRFFGAFTGFNRRLKNLLILFIVLSHRLLLGVSGLKRGKLGRNLVRGDIGRFFRLFLRVVGTCLVIGLFGG
jgi:hypothetical protein